MAVNRKGPASGTGIIIVYLLVLVAAMILLFGNDVVRQVSAAWWGLLPIAVALAVIVATTGKWNPLVLAVGGDGRLSLSKFQTLLWTLGVLYAYGAIYAHDLQYPQPATVTSTTTTTVPGPAPVVTPVAGATPSTTTTTTVTTTSASGAVQPPLAAPTPMPGAVAPIQFPETVLLLLGFAVTSLVGAAAIASNQMARGVISTKTVADDLSLRWLVATNDGNVDLTRFQFLIWTLVATGVFLSDTWYFIRQPIYAGWLPDVGSALVLLMGFGHAAYLGGKFVVTPGKPIIARLSTPSASPSDKVTITGSGFGPKAATSSVLMNKKTLEVADADWTDATIAFSVPARMPPDDTAWPAQPTPASIAVVVGTLQSENETLTVQPKPPLV